VGLANKECLVAAGELITAEAQRQANHCFPIDSEHNAVHQCLRGGRMNEVSGCGLRLPAVLFSDACFRVRQDYRRAGAESSHMENGRRITIDSATLMNKVLR